MYNNIAIVISLFYQLQLVSTDVNKYIPTKKYAVPRVNHHHLLSLSSSSALSTMDARGPST